MGVIPWCSQCPILVEQKHVMVDKGYVVSLISKKSNLCDLLLEQFELPIVHAHSQYPRSGAHTI